MAASTESISPCAPLISTGRQLNGSIVTDGFAPGLHTCGGGGGGALRLAHNRPRHHAPTVAASTGSRSQGEKSWEGGGGGGPRGGGLAAADGGDRGVAVGHRRGVGCLVLPARPHLLPALRRALSAHALRVGCVGQHLLVQAVDQEGEEFLCVLRNSVSKTFSSYQHINSSY
jgi:hypothetical protein